MIAGLDAGNPRSDFFDDTAAFVSQNHREQSLRIGTRERKGIGMAYAGRDYAYQDLAGFRPGQIDFFDAQRFIGFEGNSRSGLHGSELLIRAPLYGAPGVHRQAASVPA